MTPHTISLPIAKRLRELGVPQKSLFSYWRDNQEPDFNPNRPEDELFSAAFLASELLELLPEFVAVMRRIEGYVCLDYLNYRPDGNFPQQVEKTMADAMGKMLIHLLEQGIITLPKE